MIIYFKLTGLSRPKSMTCHTMDKRESIFWPKVQLSQDRFNALWDYCKNNWDEKKLAQIECDGLYKDGTPINPVVIEVKLLNT